MESTMNERVKMLRKHLNLSQGDFAALVNCSYGSISNIENGHTGANQKTLNKIINATNVNRDWLLNGEGEMTFNETVRVSGEGKVTSWSEKAYEAIKSKNEHLEQEIKFLREMLSRIISKDGAANFLNGFDLAELFDAKKLVEIVRAAA